MLLSRLALALILLLAVHAPALAEPKSVVGVLRFDSERETLTECATGTVYWVRVLASGPNFSLAQRAAELSADLAPGESLVAELEGDVSSPPSAGPGYHVDAVLTVSRIYALRVGHCE